MHYYPFHVSDYIHDTAHLSNEEDLAFRRLLDLYYTQEKPIPNKTQEVARRIRMSKQENAVQTVLEEFFSFNVEKDHWYHKRCDETISAYQAKAERNRQIGKLGGRPKSNPEQTQTVSKPNPNQEPITNNQEPKVKSNRGSRLPSDLSLSDDWSLFCHHERPDLNALQVFNQFKDYWIAQPGQKGVKTDWDATWRNWVRRQSAPRQNPADIARVTVPGSQERDPALAKLDRDREVTKPPSLETLAKLAALRRQA